MLELTPLKLTPLKNSYSYLDVRMFITCGFMANIVAGVWFIAQHLRQFWVKLTIGRKGKLNISINQSYYLITSYAIYRVWIHVMIIDQNSEFIQNWHFIHEIRFCYWKWRIRSLLCSFFIIKFKISSQSRVVIMRWWAN